MCLHIYIRCDVTWTHIYERLCLSVYVCACDACVASIFPGLLCAIVRRFFLVCMYCLGARTLLLARVVHHSVQTEPKNRPNVNLDFCSAVQKYTYVHTHTYSRKNCASARRRGNPHAARKRHGARTLPHPKKSNALHLYMHIHTNVSFLCVTTLSHAVSASLLIRVIAVRRAMPIYRRQVSYYFFVNYVNVKKRISGKLCYQC